MDAQSILYPSDADWVFITNENYPPQLTGNAKNPDENISQSFPLLLFEKTRNLFTQIIPQLIRSKIAEKKKEETPIPLTQSQIIDKIIDKGVAYYFSRTCTDVYMGLSEDSFKLYMKLSLREHDIPSDYEKMYLEYGKNVMKDKTCQNIHRRNIMFNNGSGSYTSISFVSFHDVGDHFNLFVASLQISCELDDEIFAYEDYVSQDLQPLPNVNRDKIHNLQKTPILPKEEFERIFTFFADVTHYRQMATNMSIRSSTK